MSDILILNEDSKQTNQVDNVVDNGFMAKLNSFILSSQKLKTKQKVMFYRLLSTMINAGMSLVKSISVLEKQEKNAVVKNILLKFGDELKNGKNLSECMDLYPSSFLDAEVGMVRSGEKTGKLNTILQDLSNQIEKVDSISGKIKSALMYPAFIMVVVLGVIFIMMVVVVPKLLEIFQDKSKLPASTKTLILISDFFVNYWYVIIFLILFIKMSISFWRKTESGKYMYDDFMLKVPVFGGIVKKMILSKFSRVFSGLISSGISVVESLNIVSDVVGNEVYRQKILFLKQDVEVGIKIWESLDGDPLFPDMIVQMIQVGEQTAKLDKTIVKVAEFYEEQVDNVISTLNKLLEPFIIIFLAIVVGFIAIAIMQPIMGLADMVSEG